MIATPVTAMWFGLLLATTDAPSASDVVLLKDYAPCGPISLYLVTRFKQMNVEWPEVLHRCGEMAADRTHSFADLAGAATDLGMHPVGLQTDRQALARLPMPAIIQVRDPDRPDDVAHLLVLLQVKADGVMLLDAPAPAYFMPDSRLGEIWTGNVLAFAGSAAEAEALRVPTETRNWLRIILWCWIGAGGVWLLVAGYRVVRKRNHDQPGGLAATGWISRSLHGKGRLAAGGTGVAAFVIGAGAVVSSGLLAQGAKPPRCYFREPIVELGELAPGQEVVRVVIHNPGDAPLQITGVQSTCSCANVGAPDTVEPRSSAEVTIDLRIAPGPRNARITIESNDPEGAKTVLLAWHGRGEPVLTPSLVSEDFAPLGRPYERTLKLVYPGGKTATVPRLVRLEGGSSRLQITEGANNLVAARYSRSGMLTNVLGEKDLHVRVEAPTAAETFHAIVTAVFEYGSGNVQVYLPITVRFAPDGVRPDGDAVAFVAGSPEDLRGQERSVRVKARDARSAVEVLDAPRWLSHEISERDDSGFTLRLRVTEAPGSEFVSETLHIRVGSETAALDVSTYAGGAPRASRISLTE
jgi:hypothetical protein